MAISEARRTYGFSSESQAVTLRERLDECRRAAILEALDAEQTVTQAAMSLAVDRSFFYKLVKALGIRHRRIGKMKKSGNAEWVRLGA